MRFQRKDFAALFLGIFFLTPSTLNAQVFWTDWTSQSSPTTVSGSLNVFSEAIQVTYSGSYSFAQTDGGTNYWNYPVYDVDGSGTRPPTSDIIALNYAASHTLTFSAPVVDPYFAIVSLGQSGYPVSYSFSDAFTVLPGSGTGYFGGGSYTTSADNKTFTGYEYHGVLQFQGTFESLTWNSTPDEYWHGFTVGVAGAESVVPEPGTVILLATGLLGVGFVAYRRKGEDEEV